MPSYVTHHIFAQTVQRVTGDSVAHIAASYPAGYRWGAQGPEPLSQYHTPFPSQTHRLAQRMRTEPPAPLFEALCEAAVQEHNTAALAYVFGFCTNYALDRVTHAFIAAQAERLALYVPGYSAEARRKLAEFAASHPGFTLDDLKAFCGDPANALPRNALEIYRNMLDNGEIAAYSE